MKKLKKHPRRLARSHPHFPHDLILKDEDGNEKQCKYCGRMPLVEGFDFQREKDGLEEVCCYECFRDHRGDDTAHASLIHLGYIMSGLSENDAEFPLAPKKGMPEIEQVGRCYSCSEPIFYNNRTHKLVGAYNELLRGIQLHDHCPLPTH